MIVLLKGVSGLINQSLVFFRVAAKDRFYCTTLFPIFYPVNLQHSSCKHIFLIRVEQSVDPDQTASSFFGPDLDPNCLTLNSDGFFKRVDFEKSSANVIVTKKHAKLPSMQNYPACKDLNKSVSYLKLWDYKKSLHNG